MTTLFSLVCNSLKPKNVTPKIQRFFHSQQSKQNSSKSYSFLKTFAVGYAFGLGLSWFLWHKRNKNNNISSTDTDRYKFGKKVLVKSKGYWIPEILLNDDKIMNTIPGLKLGDRDVIVCSFPKSGTTWVQEIVYLINNKVDLVEARSRVMEDRFPYLEYPYPGLNNIMSRSEPRLIKTHLPYSFLPKCLHNNKGKIIYIARNPKDVSVSYYHFTKMFTELSFDGSFNDFYEDFFAGRVPYGPWWSHVSEFWEHRDDENILYITYEDLQQNPKKMIKMIAEFLGADLTDSQIKTLCAACSFNVMRKNPSSNYSWWNTLGLRRKQETEFLRKGIVGDWKNYYNSDMNSQMDNLIQEHISKKGLQFKYDP